MLSVPTLVVRKLWDHTFEERVINIEIQGKRNGSKYCFQVLSKLLEQAIKDMVLQEKDFRSTRWQVFGFLKHKVNSVTTEFFLPACLNKIPRAIE